MKQQFSRCTTDTILNTLAADLACDVRDLQGKRVVFVEAQKMPGRRRFPWRLNPFLVVHYGESIVVSSTAERLPWLQHHLGTLSPSELINAHTIALLSDFLQDNGQSLAGPDIKYLCQKVPTIPLPTGHDLTLTVSSERKAIVTLYQDHRFPNALTYNPEGQRTDAMVCLTYHGGELIGVAGASTDTDELWQVGIDVLPAWRKFGVGRALVSRLTAEIFALGKVPYYSTVISNIASQRLATSVGYRPAWLELYAC